MNQQVGGSSPPDALHVHGPLPEVRRPDGTLRAFVEARQLVPDIILPILSRAEDLAHGAPPVPVSLASSATLFFQQPSTRTYLSFAHAAGSLGYHTADLRDMRTTSFEKGESLEDGLRTIAELSELVILRQPNHEALLDFVRTSAALPRPPIVVNAGSEEHPTQSLIDVATCTGVSSIRPVDGKKLSSWAICNGHERSILCSMFFWVAASDVCVCAHRWPRTFRVPAASPRSHGRTFEVCRDLDEALTNAERCTSSVCKMSTAEVMPKSMSKNWNRFA